MIARLGKSRLLSGDHPGQVAGVTNEATGLNAAVRAQVIPPFQSHCFVINGRPD